MSNKRHRIILDLAKATKTHCRDCSYLDFDGTCRIFKVKLNWDEIGIHSYYRCDDCKFYEVKE